MGIGGGARDSDRDGRFLGPSSSFLSLLPRTLRSSSAVAPSSEEEEIELVKKFFKYEELMDSTKLVESAKRVLSISSELSDVDNRKPFEDKGRMSTLDGQDGAMTRRQGLGRKKAQFTFRPNMSDSLPEKGPTLNTEQLHNPEDFFLAFERHENAERELRKLKGETPLDTTKPSLSEVARPRRPGLLGRRASFKHVYQAPVDNAEVLESLQENVLEMAVSPANTPTTAQRTQRPGPLQPMGTNNTQVRNVSHGKGSIAETEKRINHHLDILMSSCKDMGEQETLVYLRERLQIKPIEIEKLDLSDLDIVRRDAQRDLLQQLPRPRKVSTNFQGGTYAAVVDEGKDAETGELGTFGSLQKSQSPPRNLLTSVEKSEKHFSHDLLQGLSSILRNNGASTSDHHLSSAEPERAFPPPVNGGIGMKSTNNSDKFTFIRSENGVSFDAEVQSTVDTEGIIGSNINPVEMLRNDLPFSYEIDEFVDRLIVDMEVRAMDLDEGSQDKADYIPSERVMDLDGVSEHKADNISKETRAMDLDVGSQDKADDIPSERVMDFDGVSEQKADDNSKETRAMDLDVGSQDKADEIPSERVMNFDGVSEQKADDILKETRAMDLDVGSQDKADDITREASASREQQVGSGVLLSRTWDHSGTEEPPFHLDQNTNKIHMDAVVHPAELDHNLANEFTVRSVPPDASVSQGEELVDQTVATREGNTKKRKGVGRGKRHALKGQSVLSGDHDHTESSSILSDQSNKENHAPSKASPSKCKNQNTSPHRQARKKRDVPRHSLAGAGTKIESGLRRSTRIKLKPLEYWRGERLLYGRIHDSLATVIGVQYFSPGPDKKKSVLKVKSYVSEEYTDLLERAASH